MRKLLLLPLVLIIPLVLAGRSLTTIPASETRNLIASNAPAALASKGTVAPRSGAVTLAPTPEEGRAARLVLSLIHI